MYIEFEGVAGTGGCRGVRGEDVGVLPEAIDGALTGAGEDVGASVAIAARFEASDRKPGGVVSRGETDTDVIEAEWTW
jgi:hypothetical protein